MKKWGLLGATGFLVIVVSYSLWASQAAVKSGIYPVKNVGLELVVVEEEQLLSPIRLPVRWVKQFPWDQSPVIHEVALFDANGEVFSAVGGEYQLHIPSEPKWYERNVYGEVELYLNGASFAEVGSVSSTAIETRIEQQYAVDRVSIVFGGERQEFQVEGNYRYETTEEQSVDLPWQVEGVKFFSMDQSSEIHDGLLVHLKGEQGHIVEEVGFWLPGMKEDYFEGDALYNTASSVDTYLNSNKPFDGEKLILPHEVGASSMLIYLPFTKEMKEASENSVVRLMPYFKMVNGSGESYYVGGNAGMVAPIQSGLKLTELIYEPSEEH